MIPIWLNWIVTIAAYIAMAALCGWIARQCWRDSKDDFREAFRGLYKLIKKENKI